MKDFLFCLSFIGVTNILFQYFWWLPRFIFTILGTFVNQNLAFSLDRILSISIQSICMIFFANHFSSNGFQYVLFIIVGFLVIIYSISTSVENARNEIEHALLKQDKNLSNSLHNSIKIDKRVSIPFSLVFFISVSIFPELCTNEFTLLYLKLLKYLAGISFIGGLTIFIGLVGVVWLIGNFLFKMFFLVVTRNNN